MRLALPATRADWEKAGAGWPDKAVGWWDVMCQIPPDAEPEVGTVLTEPDEDGCVLVVWDDRADDADDGDGDGMPFIIAWCLPTRVLEVSGG